MVKRILKKLPSFTLNVLIYRDGDVWIAHCLEMDIVAADPNLDNVKKDIVDLISAQISFAQKHGNLNNIFKPAPPEDWAKLLSVNSCDYKKLVKIDSPIIEIALCCA